MDLDVCFQGREYVSVCTSVHTCVCDREIPLETGWVGSMSTLSVAGTETHEYQSPRSRFVIYSVFL